MASWINKSIGVARSGFASTPKAVKRGTAILGVAISIALLALSVKSGISKISVSHLRLDWLAASLVSGMVYFIALGVGWGELNSSPDKFKSFGVWSVTQAVHFLPGGIWTPATRAISVEGRAAKKTAMVATESVLQLAATAIAGGGMLSLSNLWLGIGAEAGGVAVFLIALALKDKIGTEAQGTVSATVFYLAGRIAYMVSYMAAQLSLGPSSHFPLIGWSACLSWSVGLIAIFAPGGIGVREAIYVSVLGSTISETSAQAGALVGRVVLTVAELAVLGAYGLAAGRQKAKQALTQRQKP